MTDRQISKLLSKKFLKKPVKWFRETINRSHRRSPPPQLSPARSAGKDYAGVTFTFTAMLLKKLPDVVDTNPAKIILRIAKIVLEIKDVRCHSSHRCLTDYV